MTVMTAPSLARGLLDAPGPSYGAHLAAHGPLPEVDLHRLVEEAALTGRGGAGFPTATKLRSVAAAATATGRAPVVVANGSEGEPAAAKDATLLVLAPHLVFDGLALVAASLGAGTAYLAAGPEMLPALSAHLAERRDPLGVRLHPVADAFLSGEESALCAALEGRPPLPRTKFPPVRERGVDGRPTLVLNVETLARLALVARGNSRAAACMLVTRRMEIAGTPWVDVVDVPLGSRLGDVLRLDDAQAVLIGGYAGTWVPARRAAGLRLDRGSLAPAGAALGAGVLAALPADRCGLRETARVVGYLAGQSAGQCGPCLNGLPRIAAALDLLARPTAPPSGLLRDMRRWAGLLPGRGACSHPDATVRLVASALEVFSGELAHHRAGHCTGRSAVPFLPAPFLPVQGARR
jgi:NADH:ubiquinone oxidoreductase subunit F (NADH-binding)